MTFVTNFQLFNRWCLPVFLSFYSPLYFFYFSWIKALCVLNIEFKSQSVVMLSCCGSVIVVLLLCCESLNTEKKLFFSKGSLIKCLRLISGQQEVETDWVNSDGSAHGPWVTHTNTLQSVCTASLMFEVIQTKYSWITQKYQRQRFIKPLTSS